MNSNIWLAYTFLGIMKVKMLVTQSSSTLCSTMDCSPPGSSVHGILQARILEWVAIPFSRRSSQSRDWTQVSCITGRFWATREVLALIKLFRQVNLFFSVVGKIVEFSWAYSEFCKKATCTFWLTVSWSGRTQFVILYIVLGWEEWRATKVLTSILISFWVKRTNFMLFQAVEFSSETENQDRK